ncbi:hypothetical protein [Marinobacter sp. LV10R510-11A]|uniref:hypothetical protein n=1 Tax=Marinobacter sp. LV10R510-11A TaxID=1415568 RepID=UPI001D0D5E41|nr:hypothetical protein [Marinobacter sp. LV10R510-11A]
MTVLASALSLESSLPIARIPVFFAFFRALATASGLGLGFFFASGFGLSTGG